MTPLGCPDCLLIRYEPRALRARLRVNANARARVRHSRARSRFPTELVSLEFFSFPFCGRGSFFGLFACTRFCCFVCPFFCGEYAMSVSASRFTAERGNRENSWFRGAQPSNCGYEILDAITISLEYHLLLSRPIIFRMPRNKAPVCRRGNIALLLSRFFCGEF